MEFTEWLVELRIMVQNGNKFVLNKNVKFPTFCVVSFFWARNG